MDTKLKTFLLDDDCRDKLRKLALIRGQTEVEVVRRALLREFLQLTRADVESYEQCYGAAN